MINVFTVLTVKTQQLENVEREPRQHMPQLNLGLHADHAAIFETVQVLIGIINTWLVSINILKYTVYTLRAHIH